MRSVVIQLRLSSQILNYFNSRINVCLKVGIKCKKKRIIHSLDLRNWKDGIAPD